MTAVDAARRDWINRARVVPLETVLNGTKLCRVGAELIGPCPKCGGTDRFGVNVRNLTFNCRQCGRRGKGSIDLQMFLDGSNLNDAVEKLTGEPAPKPNGNDPGKPHHEAGAWVYQDADGKPYLRVRRFDKPDGSKSYPQYHWDPQSQWAKGKPAGPKIPYRLLELLDSDRSEPVFIVEGEKCADRLARESVAVTTASEGAGKWTADLNEWFRGRIVWIIPDNDAQTKNSSTGQLLFHPDGRPRFAGQDHAEAVARNLNGIAAEVKIVPISGLPIDKDVFDFLEAGGSVDDLLQFGERAPVWAAGNAKSENEPRDTADITAAFTFVGHAPASPPRELIKGLLPAEGVAVTGGQSSAGKTFIKIYKSICLATELPYFGHKIVEPVGTIFVAAEGRATLPNRFAAALAKEAVTKKLPIAWLKQLPDFSSLDGIKTLVKQLKAMDERFRGEFGVRLGMVPIDTVAASFSMKDEDDNSEATKVCNVMRSIGDEVGALMAPVHHYGKNPESGLRGASAWRGSADIIEGVLADLDPLTGRALSRELVCAKARDGEQGPLSPFELQFLKLGVDADGEPYGSCCVVPIAGQSRFEKAATLSKSQRAIQDAIAEALDRHGKVITPRAGMATVKAVKVTDVREEFDRRYVVDESDPAKASNAKRMAFKRALDHLSPSQFGAGSAEATDWLWRIT
jgi:hypothetical protein